MTLIQHEVFVHLLWNTKDGFHSQRLKPSRCRQSPAGAINLSERLTYCDKQVAGHKPQRERNPVKAAETSLFDILVSSVQTF